MFILLIIKKLVKAVVYIIDIILCNLISYIFDTFDLSIKKGQNRSKSPTYLNKIGPIVVCIREEAF